MLHCFLIALLGSSDGEKITFFFANLGGEKLLESAGEKLLSGVTRGLKYFGQVSERFPDSFFAFVKPFFVSGKSKWGLSKWGLKVLVHNCPRLPTIVIL